MDPNPQTVDSPPVNDEQVDHTLEACRLLNREQFASSRNPYSCMSRTLLRMQTLLLLAVNADKRIVSHSQEQQENGHRSILSDNTEDLSAFSASMINKALGCADELRLMDKSETIANQIDISSEKTQGIDEEDCLARRACFVLVILDQWRSMLTQSPLLVPNNWIHLKDGDRHNLGDVGYNFVQISCLLGEIAGIQYDNLGSPLNGSHSLDERIEGFRKNGRDLFDQNPVLNIAWWCGSRLTSLTIGTSSWPPPCIVGAFINPAGKYRLR